MAEAVDAPARQDLPFRASRRRRPWAWPGAATPGENYGMPILGFVHGRAEVRSAGFWIEEGRTRTMINVSGPDVGSASKVGVRTTEHVPSPSSGRLFWVPHPANRASGRPLCDPHKRHPLESASTPPGTLPTTTQSFRGPRSSPYPATDFLTGVYFGSSRLMPKSGQSRYPSGRNPSISARVCRDSGQVRNRPIWAKVGESPPQINQVRPAPTKLGPNSTDVGWLADIQIWPDAGNT